MHLITLNLICYVGSLALGLILTPIAIRLANFFGVVDLPGARKVHHAPTPRVGGLAIAAATVVPFLIALALAPRPLTVDGHESMKLMTLLVAAGSLMALGFVDDLYCISAKYKLVVLIAASILLCGAGGRIETLTISGRPLIYFGELAWPITILWLVGVTVSINFIDGLDGLAAGIVAIAAGVLAVGSTVGGYPLCVLLLLALLGALSGFLVFNFYPARIFMGDCGSMFIGFTLAASAVLANHSIGSTRALILPALALSIPIFDTLFTMVRRSVLHRSSLFAAERGHVHHRLLDSGLWHPHVVILLHVVTLAAAVVAMISIFAGNWPTTIAAIAFGVLLLGLFRTAGSVRARDTVTAIRRNRAISREADRYNAAFHETQLRFRQVDNFDDWWQQLVRCAEAFDFLKLNLPIVRRDGAKTALRWRRDDSELAQSDSITAEIPVAQRRLGETLRIGVEMANAKFTENNGRRLSHFTQLMGEFGLDRLPIQQKIQSPSGHVDSQAAAESVLAAAAADQAVDLVPSEFANLRVAIVHDFLYTYAGAERVLEQFINIFPHADLFALFDFLQPNQRGFIRNKRVQTSFLQRMPFAKRHHRAYLPLMPIAIEQLDVSKYDLVISSSYVAAKGVLTRPDQLHVCYCYTPVRFAWDLHNQYLTQTELTNGVRSMAARLILHYIRSWDLRSAQGVDLFLTLSDYVGRRIEKRYRRQSVTIYPPVDTETYTLQENKQDYYLTASRMVPYKRIDLIVEAFSRMPTRRLVVVGDGPEMQRIKAKAGPNVTLLGHASADRLLHHMQNAKAFVFAAEEDFGIVAVEAQACGTPVIAFGRGGATETVVDGQTGLFFEEQTVDSIVDAVNRFESQTWSPQVIRQHSEGFSAANFREQITQYFLQACNDFKVAKGKNRRDPGNQKPGSPKPESQKPGSQNSESQNSGSQKRVDLFATPLAAETPTPASDAMDESTSPR